MMKKMIDFKAALHTFDLLSIFINIIFFDFSTASIPKSFEERA